MKKVTLRQRIELSHEVGDAATLLYLYYYDKAGYEKFDITDDKKTAKELGLPIRKVQRLRLKLTNAGWLYRAITTNQEIKVIVTAIGKEEVNGILKNDSIPDKCLEIKNKIK